jgi:hypothetical protein
MTPCLRVALGHAFAVVLYARAGYATRSEIALVELLAHIVQHQGTGAIGGWS